MNHLRYVTARYVFTSESQLYVNLTKINTLATSCHLGIVWLATGASQQGPLLAV
jgi:hypothetical protein